MERNDTKLARRRFDRQFDELAKHAPWIARLRAPRWLLARWIAALVLILGGFLAILPVFGLWMIPVGLLFLAVDVPVLQGPVAAMIIRARRWGENMRRRFKG